MLASIARTLPRQFNLTGLSSNAVRTYFSPSYFAVDSFKNYASIIEKEQGRNASSLKLAIEEGMSKPDSKIFTEDLKTMLYLTKTDADIDLLLNAIRKYQQQESSTIFNFNFESPLIRLLYTLNKTDRALNLFLDEKDTVLQKIYTPGVILMNKLLEEKRYSDAVKVFNRILNKFKAEKKENPSKLLKTMDLSNLVTEALLGLNNLEALETGKQMLKDFKQLNIECHDNGFIKLILLAYNQNQFDFAYELTTKIKNKNKNIINNLRVLCLLRMNRVDDAISLAEDTSKIVTRGQSRLFFKETLAMLEDLASKLEGEKKDRVNDLVTTIKQENKLIDLSLNDYALKLRENKDNQQQQQQRNNNQENRVDGQQRQQRFDSQRQQDGQERRNYNRSQGQQQQQQRQYNRDNRSNRTQRENNQRED
ncbi:unnamed protein product [Brachionus calyciflorus]|uniref:Uncharacterized protein n=1 Tax=Brachionus calyciflorus TaxID=104777 RepID=A0A814DRE9_9BILA|nr:unnamed protein product [Brachionus calyciflorus]